MEDGLDKLTTSLFKESGIAIDLQKDVHVHEFQPSWPSEIKLDKIKLNYLAKAFKLYPKSGILSQIFNKIKGHKSPIALGLNFTRGHRSSQSPEVIFASTRKGGSTYVPILKSNPGARSVIYLTIPRRLSEDEALTTAAFWYSNIKLPRFKSLGVESSNSSVEYYQINPTDDEREMLANNKNMIEFYLDLLNTKKG